MQGHARFEGRKLGKRIGIAALCLAAVPAFAQTSIDTAFARKLYSAGHDDLFHVEVGLKNAAFGSAEGIDTAKTDAFFGRHEIRATADRNSLISKPPGYARSYELYISPTEVILFMEDTLVERLVDLEAAKPVSLGIERPRGNGRGNFAIRPMGQWLLGRMIGPRPDVLAKLP